METVRGRVLELNNKHIVLLSTDGRYLKLPTPPGKIRLGEEIELCVQPARSRRRFISIPSLSAVAAVLLFVMFLPYLFSDNNADSRRFYLALDINPSVELVVDFNLHVLEYRALNSDGEKVLEGLPVGARLFDAVNDVLERAVALSYLKGEADDNLVLLTLAGNVPAEVTVAHLEMAVHDRLIMLGIDGHVGVFEAGETELNEAHKRGNSLNRYFLEKAAVIPEKTPPATEYSLQEMVERAGPPVQERMLPVQSQKPPGLPGPSPAGEEPGRPVPGRLPSIAPPRPPIQSELHQEQNGDSSAGESGFTPTQQKQGGAPEENQ
jgi:hypothetical protein